MAGWQDLISNAKLAVEALNKIASGISQVVNLPNGSVTNAKLADVPSGTFKGRVASGAGPVSDLAFPAYGEASYTTWSGLTANIPLDDTIPQITEGTEILSVSVTPTSATSNLFVSWSGEYTPSTSSATANVVSVFRDATADAVYSTYTSQAATDGTAVSGSFSIPSTATTATTISLRVGPSGAYTSYVNGSGASRLLGGSMAWTLVVREVL